MGLARAGVELFAQDKATRSLNKFNKSLNTITGTMRTVAATAGVGLGLYGVVRGFRSIVDAASEAEETQSKFNTVFKNLAEPANEWAEEFGGAVGRAEKDVRKWMAGLQDTFVPLGFARGKAFDLSKQLTELAVDVASFNNVSDPEVINSFTSAIVGNHEAVRKYGVVITEAELAAEAQRQGYEKSVKNLSAYEKAQLRFNLIMNGTKDAQGDALRTADSYANQVKRLDSNFTNLKVALGNEVLPIMTELVASINNNEGAIEDIVDSFKVAVEFTVKFSKALWSHRKAIVSLTAGYIALKTAMKIQALVTGVSTALAAANVHLMGMGAYVQAAGGLGPAFATAIPSITKFGVAAAAAFTVTEVTHLIQKVKEYRDVLDNVNEHLERQDGILRKAAERRLEQRVTIDWEIPEEIDTSKMRDPSKPFISDEDIKEAEKFAADQASAYRDMYSDMGVHARGYYDWALKAIEKQEQKYRDLMMDEVLVTQWAEEQKRKLFEETHNAQNEFNVELQRWADDASNVWRNLGQVATRALDDISDQLTDLAITGKADFRSLAAVALRELVKIQIQAAMVDIGGGITGGFLGLFGKKTPTVVGADINPAMANVAHRGAIAGVSATTKRRVDPLDFIGAPRLHLGQNEVPVIAKKGEVFLPEGTPISSGGAPTVNITVNNEQGISSDVQSAPARLEGGQWVVDAVVENYHSGGEMYNLIGPPKG